MTDRVDHTHPRYIERWRRMGLERHNGAFYYSREIVDNIIPIVRTERPWATINVEGAAFDHAIVFIHNNLYPERYDWLQRYKDLILVCGIGSTTKKVAHLGKAIYLPLSIDVEEVQRHAHPKTKGAAFVGRPSKRRGLRLPAGVDFIEGLPRDKLLDAMSEYHEVYAVGRTALEAKALGCKIRAYDPRFPHTNRWRVIDNKDAARILQEKLDKIDGIK